LLGPVFLSKVVRTPESMRGLSEENVTIFSPCQNYRRGYNHIHYDEYD